jgi:hypothetical protein
MTVSVGAGKSFAWEPIGTDGVAKIRWSSGAIITEDLARMSVVELADLVPSGKRVPVLADIRQLKAMTREGRVFYGHAAETISAVALLAQSPATRMVANFFLGLNRPNVPTQMFTEEEKAIAWLRHYVM